MINAYHEALTFEIPAEPGLKWKKVIDTYQLAPHDIFPENTAPVLLDSHCEVQARSIVFLSTVFK